MSDGSFRLLSYHIGTQSVVVVPLYVRHSVSFRTGPATGRLDLTVGPKQTMGRTVENVLLEISMPKQAGAGSSPDRRRGLISWGLGREADRS